MIEPLPETLEAMKEKFLRIDRERGRLPQVTYRLRRRAAPSRGRAGGGKPADAGMESFPPEIRARIQQRYNRYLQNARERGKDLSKHYYRQPYLMIAIRWELADQEKRRADYAKSKRTIQQKSYYYGIMSRRAKRRMRGVADVTKGEDHR